MDRLQYLVSGTKIIDLVAMVSCFIVSAILVTPRLDVATIREFMVLQVSLGNFLQFGSFVALWHLLFSAFGLCAEALSSSVWHLSYESDWMNSGKS